MNERLTFGNEGYIEVDEEGDPCFFSACGEAERWYCLLSERANAFSVWWLRLHPELLEQLEPEKKEKNVEAKVLNLKDGSRVDLLENGNLVFKNEEGKLKAWYAIINRNLDQILPWLIREKGYKIGFKEQPKGHDIKARLWANHGVSSKALDYILAQLEIQPPAPVKRYRWRDTVGTLEECHAARQRAITAMVHEQPEEVK